MIEVSHITKTYRVAHGVTLFSPCLPQPVPAEYEVIRALDDVSFTIEDGKW